MLAALIVITAFSCRQREETRTFMPEVTQIDLDINDLEEIRAIFYDLASPMESQRLFQQINILFDENILNQPENIYRYNSSNKIAVNLGIYGTAMSFAHMFGQTQEAINYMSVIYRMADRLGIGGNIINQAEAVRDGVIYQPDSLFRIASSLYIEADRQLRQNERHGAAALIIAGGWVEGLYIACHFHDPEDPDLNLEQQILAQKYSLDRLTALLANYQDDPFIARYLLMFRQLKNVFDSVEILFEEDDLIIDTASRTIVSKERQYVYNPRNIEEIIRLVGIIREDMIQ
ncbi:MAG: hypothetical protein EA408_08535 [Marinilabiliales bacterium]|nr:MAG: hypothetical protein EA408_08535 [Marinilabiliales bacterium]